MLTVEITSMPASSSSSTSCQRFSLREPGHVRVRELVDEGDRRPAGEDRVDVHLLELLASVLDGLARDDLEVTDLGCGVRAAVELDKADHDVLAPLRRRDPSFSMANVLPTPGEAPR